MSLTVETQRSGREMQGKRSEPAGVDVTQVARQRRRTLTRLCDLYENVDSTPFVREHAKQYALAARIETCAPDEKEDLQLELLGRKQRIKNVVALSDASDQAEANEVKRLIDDLEEMYRKSPSGRTAVAAVAQDLSGFLVDLFTPQKQ